MCDYVLVCLILRNDPLDSFGSKRMREWQKKLEVLGLVNNPTTHTQKKKKKKKKQANQI